VYVVVLLSHSSALSSGGWSPSSFLFLYNELHAVENLIRLVERDEMDAFGLAIFLRLSLMCPLIFLISWSSVSAGLGDSHPGHRHILVHHLSPELGVDFAQLRGFSSLLQYGDRCCGGDSGASFTKLLFAGIGLVVLGRRVCSRFLRTLERHAQRLRRVPSREFTISSTFPQSPARRVRCHMTPASSPYSAPLMCCISLQCVLLNSYNSILEEFL